MRLIEYFGRTCIINLPEQVERLRLLKKELKPFGADAHPEKVQVPYAPRPEDANGFASKGVYGSFLSHLGILQQARRDGLETVWTLEDDATFSRRMIRDQGRLIDQLRRTHWDFCFFGHSLWHELDGLPEGLVPYAAPFSWMHCYAVHSGIFSRVIAYLEETLVNDIKDPRGARLYIDPAFGFFRRLNPDVITLVANPVMSIQRGCVSTLASGQWYDSRPYLTPWVSASRWARDEIWRRTGLFLTRSRGRGLGIEAAANRPWPIHSR
jgi:hypothetical protein